MFFKNPHNIFLLRAAAGLASFVCVLAMGCGGSDDGFRFDGEYSADRSGIVFRIVAQGYVPEGGGAVGEAFAIAQVCPSGITEGRPVRMTFTVTKEGRTNIECRELGPVAMEWTGRNSEGMMRGLLTSAGFRQIDPAELAGCIAAIGRAIGSEAPGAPTPPGGALRVLREDLTEGSEIDHGKLPAEWVAPSEVAGCK
jgi:hypothetical protein